jgi:hypothetical protein
MRPDEMCRFGIDNARLGQMSTSTPGTILKPTYASSSSKTTRSRNRPHAVAEVLVTSESNNQTRPAWPGYGTHRSPGPSLHGPLYVCFVYPSTILSAVSPHISGSTATNGAPHAIMPPRLSLPLTHANPTPRYQTMQPPIPSTTTGYPMRL